MTYGDLLLMLQSDVNRADKEVVFYPLWINRALRKIQTDCSFSFMRTRADVALTAGNASALLPSTYKELTPELYPVTVVDPSLVGPFAELPCELTSREKILSYRASTFVPALPANVRGRLNGLPVWVENTASGWTLNLIDALTQDVTFRVSHYGFLPDLAAETDTNALLTNYPDLVENKVKAIAFTSINDPVAAMFEGNAAKLMQEAVLDDKRRGWNGRPLRMGG